MAEAAHGTAPSLFGKDVANPMAMILAGAACSPRTSKARPPAGDPRGDARDGRGGLRTADLGGHAGSREFTDEVIRRTTQKLEVWASL